MISLGIKGILRPVSILRTTTRVKVPIRSKSHHFFWNNSRAKSRVKGTNMALISNKRKSSPLFG
jgi:hypothetical protein